MGLEDPNGDLTADSVASRHACRLVSWVFVSSSLKPGLLSVTPVFFAECGFEHGGFPAGTDDLHGDDDDQQKQEPPGGNEHGESEKEKAAENIDGIADTGIEPGGDQAGGLGANR